MLPRRLDLLNPVDVFQGLHTSDEATLRRVLVELAVEATSHMTHTDHTWSDEWFEELSKQLISMGSIVAPAQRVDLLILAFEWYFSKGDLGRAEPLIVAAIELSRRSSAEASLRRSLSVMGALQTKQLCTTKAIASLAEAAEIAQRTGDVLGLCAVLSNLSSTKFDIGLLDEVIALNRFVVASCIGQPMRQAVMSVAYHNIAASLEVLGDLEGAAASIELANKTAQPPETSFWIWQATIRHAAAARIYVRLGRFDDANKEVEIVRVQAQRTESAPARIHLALAEALLSTAEGKAVGLESLAGMERSIPHDQPIYRDYLQTMGLCRKLSGQEGRQFDEEHLRCLSAWQRSVAIQQIAALQRSVRARTDVTDSLISPLPVEARAGLISRSKNRRNRKELLGQVESLATLAELREASSGEHSARVGWLSRMLAKSIGYDDKRAAVFDMSARLHDIGKLAVPDVVLLKRGKLTPIETEIIHRHALEGCTMLTDILASAESIMASGRSSEDQTLRLAAEIALHHHEWWDGTGYPRRLEGEAIPEAARIVAIADTFDELIQTRPYHEAATIDVALLEVIALSGRQFDPKLVIAFKDLIQSIQVAGGADLDTLKGVTRKNTSTLAKANQIIERILKSPEAQRTRAKSIEPASTTQH